MTDKHSHFEYFLVLHSSNPNIITEGVGVYKSDAHLVLKCIQVLQRVQLTQPLL